MDDMDKEIAIMKNQLQSEKKLMEKAKHKGANLNNYSDYDEEENKQWDMYDTEQIYERDLMSQQQRRFGSPEFAVRNNSMMYEPPTNNLTTVKPGVELTGLEK